MNYRGTREGLFSDLKASLGLGECDQQSKVDSPCDGYPISAEKKSSSSSLPTKPDVHQGDSASNDSNAVLPTSDVTLQSPKKRKLQDSESPFEYLSEQFDH